MKTKVNEIEGELFSEGKASTEPPAKTKKRGQEVATQSARAVQDAPPVDPFLAMVREVALNPNLDVTKLDALLKMQERIMDRQARQKFDAELAAMQAKFPVIERRGRIEIRKKGASGERDGDLLQSSPYAKWEDIVEAVNPVLQEHGFSLTFKPSMTEKGMVRVEGTLAGHGWRETTFVELPHDSTGSKNSIQAIGSAQSYGKRMVGTALLNIVSRGEDDDGKTSGEPIAEEEVLSAEQLEQVIDLAGAAQCPAPKLLDYLNRNRPRGHRVAKELGDLPASRFDDVIAALRLYEAKAKAAQK